MFKCVVYSPRTVLKALGLHLSQDASEKGGILAQDAGRWSILDSVAKDTGISEPLSLINPPPLLGEPPPPWGTPLFSSVRKSYVHIARESILPNSVIKLHLRK